MSKCYASKVVNWALGEVGYTETPIIKQNMQNILIRHIPCSIMERKMDMTGVMCLLIVDFCSAMDMKMLCVCFVSRKRVQEQA